MAKTKKAKAPAKNLQLLLLIGSALVVVLLAVLVATGSGGLQTTIYDPPKIVSFEAVGRLSKTATMDSDDRILFSWQVKKGGKFDHIKLERLDPDKTRELDLGVFNSIRTVSRINIDLVPHWTERTNKFRLSVCADQACTKFIAKDVTITVTDYDPEREPTKKPVTGTSTPAEIESFTVKGKESGTAEIASTDTILFSWQVSEEDSMSNLKLVKVSDDGTETEIDLGRFSNNRKAGGVNIAVQPTKDQQENKFRLYVCAARHCVAKTTKEAIVKVKDYVPGGACTAAPLKITTEALAIGFKGQEYIPASLRATGGKRPYKWLLKSGNLPAGITLNERTGTISGVPTEIGKFTFTIELTDSSACNPALKAEKEFEISIQKL